MRPLPVLILVLVAILATITVFLLNRQPTGTGDATAVTPIERGAAPEVAPERGPLTPTAESPVRTDAVAVTPSGDDEDESAPINNRFIGRVVDAQDRGIAGASVRLSSDAMMGESLAMDFLISRQVSGKFLTTTTDDKGQYTFRAVEPGRSYYVMAQHPDFAAVQEDGIAIPKSGEVRAPDLVLHAGSVLKGYVTDVEGTPIADAELTLDSAYMMSFTMESPDRLSTKTDGQGYYEFKNCPPGPRIGSASKAGFERQIHYDINFTGGAGEIIEKHFKLGIGHMIAGRCFGPENEGVKGATVIAMNYGSNVSSRGEAITDDDGNFQIEGLAMGSYLLHIQAKGYRAAKQNRVQIDDLNLQIEMIRQNTLSGRVVDATTGKPIEDFKVQLLHVNTSVPIQGTAMVNYEPTEIREDVKDSPNGEFTLVGVDPGLFAVKVTAKKYASRVTDNFQVVDGGAQPPITVALSAGGTIKGRVFDAKGEPISGVLVTSRDGELPASMVQDVWIEEMVASRTTERKAKSGADGFFELKMLNPGRYRIQLEHATFTTEWKSDLVVNENQVTDIGSITMQSGGSVTGKVVDKNGNPSKRCVVRMYSDTEQFTARTDPEGRYTFQHIKPGIYRMAASRAAGDGAGDVILDVIDAAANEVQVQVGEGLVTNRDLVMGN